MLAELPLDCLDVVLSFAGFKAILVLGSTSVLFFRQVQTELKRRKDRFHQTFYFTDQHDPRVYLYRSTKCAPGEYLSRSRIFLLPTVRDRIDSLAEVLPSSYPSYAKVIALRGFIRQSIKPDAVSGHDCCFSQLMSNHRQLILCHRLHSEILAEAIFAVPDNIERRLSGVQSGVEAVLNVSLERYIGDVMCAFYLMGHTVSQIVEGGPGESTWVRRIYSELNMSASDRDEVDPSEGETTAGPVCSYTWYRTWVFLHSSLLRIAPTSWDQQKRLGIASPTPEISSSTASIDVARGSLLSPPRPFAGEGSKLALIGALSRISHSSPLRVTYNSFGRLGPIFRGRDLIQSHVIQLRNVVNLYHTFDLLAPEEYSRGPVSGMPPFLRAWAADEHEISISLLELHGQSRKARPMTVLPPLVTFRDSV